MNKPVPFKSLLALAGILVFPVAVPAASLLEIYQQALQGDPRIHEAEARRLAALEAEPQARGVLLPQIDFNASWTSSRSDGSRTSPQFIDPDQTPDSGDEFIEFVPFDSRSKDDTTRWDVTLRQTLFRWDQVISLRRADKSIARAEADREAAQQDLIVRVAQSYFDVLAAEDRLRAIHANRLAIARQLEQARQRFEVGLIAITDVQESQAAYDQSVADEIAAKRTLATAREFMREITGTYVGELAAFGQSLPLDSPAPSGEQAWIDLAMNQNLSLVSSRLDEQLARDEISYRRTGHYPTIDLVASKVSSDSKTDIDTGVVLDGQSVGYLPADSDFTDDSIGIQLNVPLFSGGSTSSRVREAVYLHRAAREQLQRVTRETERQTRDAYLGVLSEISRVQALEQAVASSRTALEATQAGFEVGTRTIVDVLNSQFALYQAITNFYQARYDYVLNVMRLKQAAGSLQVQDLEAIEPHLVARRTPEQEFAEEAAETPGPE